MDAPKSQPAPAMHIATGFLMRRQTDIAEELTRSLRPTMRRRVLGYSQATIKQSHKR